MILRVLKVRNVIISGQRHDFYAFDYVGASGWVMAGEAVEGEKGALGVDHPTTPETVHTLACS